jgi:hypothetical protein
MNVPIDNIKVLFPTNLELIIQFNKELLAQLEERINNLTPTTCIGDVFMKLVCQRIVQANADALNSRHF